jgi:hypothetical protein
MPGLMLEEVIKSTNDLFTGSLDMKVPEPSADWKRKLEALEEATLPTHRAKLLLDLRTWQAAAIGFRQVTTEQCVEMLMGEPHTHVYETSIKHRLEWAYCHHDDTIEQGEECEWSNNCTQYAKMEKRGFWHLPPFSKKEVWRCQKGMFNYLRREIPYGVVLRLIECKKLKLFNAFQVIAPMDAWLTDAEIDPIIVGEIWEKPIGQHTSGRENYFFIAQWK